MARPWRRQGIGSRLIAEFERAVAASGLRRYYAEVMCWNEKPQDYFTRLGYRVHGSPVPTSVFSPEVPELRLLCIVRDLPDSA